MQEWKKRGGHEMNSQWKWWKADVTFLALNVFFLFFLEGNVLLCLHICQHCNKWVIFFPLPFSLSVSLVMSCSGRQIMFSLIDHLWWWQRYQSKGFWFHALFSCWSFLSLSLGHFLIFSRASSSNLYGGGDSPWGWRLRLWSSRF